MAALITQEAFLCHEFWVLDHFLFQTRILFQNQQEDSGVPGRWVIHQNLRYISCNFPCLNVFIIWMAHCLIEYHRLSEANPPSLFQVWGTCLTLGRCGLYPIHAATSLETMLGNRLPTNSSWQNRETYALPFWLSQSLSYKPTPHMKFYQAPGFSVFLHLFPQWSLFSQLSLGR